MDSKKKIMSFIRPNLVLPIILLIPPLTLFGLIILLFSTIPTYVRASKRVSKQETSGKLDEAAEELSSANAKRYMNVRSSLPITMCSARGPVLSLHTMRFCGSISTDLPEDSCLFPSV